MSGTNGSSARVLDPLLHLADDLAGRSAPVEVAQVVEIHAVIFQLDREEYALPIARVREILRPGAITRLPGAPAHVRGITNVRGRIVPVVDLRERLGLGAAEPTARSRVLLVELGGRVVGVLVDAVSQVLRFPGAAVSQTPEAIGNRFAERVHGVARLDDRLIIVLDVDKTLLRGE
jgi:purine-binding chemotaxis protein CheW